MTAPSPTTSEQMHSEHRQWLSEDALWRDELHLWKLDIEKAQSGIEKIRQGIARHKVMLESYGGSLCLTEDAVAAHEHALASNQKGRVLLGEKASKVIHGQENNAQTERRQRHQQLRDKHYRSMASLMMLIEALNQ